MPQPERPKSPEEALSQLEQIRASARETLEKYVEIQEEFGSETTEVRSEDGRIAVVLDGDGNLTDIFMSDDQLRLKGNLGPKIAELLDEAFATYAMRQAEVAQRFLGDFDLKGLMSRTVSPEMMAKAQRNLDS